jgi:hypothetical protein
MHFLLYSAEHGGFLPRGQRNYPSQGSLCCFVLVILFHHVKLFVMSSFHLRHRCILLAAALCLTLSSLTAKAGLDYFEIYLNNQLLLKMAAGKTFNLESLRLNKSNYNDQLVIYYSQCNTPGRVGKERSITVKDGKSDILKEWKFADVTGIDAVEDGAKSARAKMTIPVKELLQLAKDHSGETLSFYYRAQGRPDGQVLASYLVDKATALLMPRKLPFRQQQDLLFPRYDISAYRGPLHRSPYDLP